MDELGDGIRRVTLPLPTRPGHVHAYLLPGEDGWTLVDTGDRPPDAKETWAAELEQAGGASRPSSSPTSTPTTSGRPPISTSSPARPSSRERSTTRSASSCGGTPAWSERLVDWFRLHGAPDDVTAELVGQSSVYRPVHPLPARPDPRRGGRARRRLGVDRRPGHADGQLCLLRDGVLVAADHLLGRITPTVGLWPASRADPLGDYLGALDRTIELVPRIALPGHGEPIEDPAGRARELKEHHRVRLEEAVAPSPTEPQTGYELSFALFGADLPRRDAGSRSPRRSRTSSGSCTRGGAPARGRRSGYLYCRLIIVGDDFPPSTGAPDGA